MPVNIEIKARVRDYESLKSRVESLSDAQVQIIPQVDTFFHCPNGRLKLRLLTPDQAQLVYYERADSDGPKRSEYHIFETDDPDHLKTALGLALGIRGEVKKVRSLYLVDQTRIHLDEVSGLGRFVELEVVLRDGQTEAEGLLIANQLMRDLGIVNEDLIVDAYMDLIEAKQQESI